MGKRFRGVVSAGVAAAAVMCGVVPAAGQKTSAQTVLTRPMDSPQPLPGPRPSKEAIQAWSDRRFGMFIHFGLYSELGGVWKGKEIRQGYSEQIEANALIPESEYAALAQNFNPVKWDPDAIVALAKAAGMKFIVITTKHHDGFSLFGTKQNNFNVVDGTPYHRDIVKGLADACARGGIRFGIYYSSIDWHDPRATKYIAGNSNPIPKAHEALNVAQLQELLSGYGPISEIWFDMGKPTPEQSARFAKTVHTLQPETMVSGRVFNYQGDFTVMGDNEVPKFSIDEPWQTPASIYPETWGYRSWQTREDLPGKTKENIERLVQVASRGGNYILNIGPEGDGSVVPFEGDVLRGMGEWIAIHGEAIYGTEAQPFRSLDFGYATVKHRSQGDTLYLFVKEVPEDGILHLPGLRSGSLQGGKAYVLGDRAKRSLPWKEDGADDAEIAVKSIDELRGRVDVPAGKHGEILRFLPVIAVPLHGAEHVRQPAFQADADRALTLTAEQADHFFNYNGRGYEDPATLYKLRWNTSMKAGKYRVTIEHGSTGAAARMDLVIDGRSIPVDAEPNRTSTSVEIAVTEKAAGKRERTAVEITPPEPFFKGTKLGVAVTSIHFQPE